MALYHKHRPQTFSDVVGQEHIVQTITNQITSEKVAHAYLFSGPRGVGKTTTARLIAKAMTCEQRKKHEPCNTCTSCTEISESRSIDVIEIDAASHTGVDHVRENIIENAQFKPTSLSHKVFIIDEVHMLSTSAFNALLKTLEEPPAHVIFILATTEPHKLPDTIISRCQRFNFKKVPYETMKKHLENVAKAESVSVDGPVLDRVINKGDGCVRDAISLLDQLMATGEKKITEEVASLVLPTSNVEESLAFVTSLVEKNAQNGLDILARLAESGTHFPQFATDVLELLRSLMIGKSTNSLSGNVDLSTDAQKKLTSLAAGIEFSDLVKLIDLLMARKAQIQSAPLPQLPLEMLVIEWCEGGTPGSSPPDTAETPAETTQVSQTVAKAAVSQAEVAVEAPVTEEPPVVETTPEPTSPPAGDRVFTVDEVKDAWNTIVSSIETDSPSLTFIFRMANVLGVEGKTISFSVPYSFHRDKVMDNLCYPKVTGIMSEVLGGPVELDVSVVAVERPQTDDSEIQELAAAFGGEVVG